MFYVRYLLVVADVGMGELDVVAVDELLAKQSHVNLESYDRVKLKSLCKWLADELRRAS